MNDNGISREVQDPPHKTYRCPLCGFWLHFSCRYACWHCYGCGTDWEQEDLLDAIEADEY